MNMNVRQAILEAVNPAALDEMSNITKIITNPTLENTNVHFKFISGQWLLKE